MKNSLRNFILVVLAIVTLQVSAQSQNNPGVGSSGIGQQSNQIRSGTSLPATCNPAGALIQKLFFKTTSPIGLHTCTATNTWTDTGASGGGGGTPGGLAGQAQYNNSGTLGGISGVSSDGTNLTAGSGNLRATSPIITTGINDQNGNILLAITPAASAVDYLALTNAAAGNVPKFTATGSSANISIGLAAKGLGRIITESQVLIQDAVNGSKLFFGGITSAHVMLEQSGGTGLRLRNGDNTDFGILTSGYLAANYAFAGVTQTPSQITGNQNNYAPANSAVHRLTSSGAFNITGLSLNQGDGEFGFIVNAGSNALTLKHQDAGSTTTNRFLSVTGSDVTLNANEIAFRIYDGTTGRFRIAKLGSASGASVNPTSGTLPYNNAGTFADSIISQSGSNVFLNGNLGVGVSNPAEKFVVKGTDGSFRVQPDFSGNTIVYAFNETAGTRNQTFYFQGNNVLFGYGLTPTEGMRLDSSGRFAVNTISPTAQTHIVSAASARIALKVDTAASATEPAIDVQLGATPGTGGDALRIRNSGGTTLTTFTSAGLLNHPVSAYNTVALRFGSGDNGITATATQLGFRTNGQQTFFLESTGAILNDSVPLAWSSTPGGVGPNTGITRFKAATVRFTNGGPGIGNVLLGSSTVGDIGTSGLGVLAIANGTAPGSRPADTVQLYAADHAAGDSRLVVLSEAAALPIILGNGQIQLGGNTSTFPMLKRANAAINVRLADDSADGYLQAAIFYSTRSNVHTVTSVSLSANQNDWSPTQAPIVRASLTANVTVTGLSWDNENGTKAVIRNISAFNLTLAHESASSTTTNRFLCSTGADIVLSQNQAADLEYDATTGRWFVYKRN